LRAEQGALLPEITGTGNWTREKSSGASLGLPGVPGFITSIYAAVVQVSYTFDVFGGERRTIESLEAQVDFERFELEASQLTLSANVVAAVIQAASAQSQIVATEEIIASQERQLSTVERQFDLGSANLGDVLAARAQLAASRATLPPLEQLLSQAEHQIAILTGRSPQQAVPVAFSLDDLTLPQELPVSLPASLLRQRPDIRAQEALLHAASARIGVATANMLPQITLTGAYGDESAKANELFKSAANVWSLSLGITQPIFRGGTLLARRRAADAAYDESLAQYRQAVLNALQNVADVLAALQNDAKTVKAQHDALLAAQASLELTERQYAVGAVNYVTLLVQQQQYQQARLGFVRALASRYQDTATLFQALGGGWGDDTEPAAAQGRETVAR
jgi:NodT family efflux transporter outer membrane factor (OMF) lipoprotein